MDCTHDDSWSDGTQRFCSWCGQPIAYVLAATGEWLDGVPLPGMHWTDMGWI